MSFSPDPEWQIQSNGQEYGPYARARILEMLAHGELPDTAAIRQQGMPDWLPVPAARQLFQSYQAAGGTLAEAQAPVLPLAPAAQAGNLAQEGEGDEAAAEAMAEGWGDAVDSAAPPAAAATEPAPMRKGAKPGFRGKMPFVYAAIALLVLAGAWWSLGGGDPAGEAGYAKVKEELVRRMEDWRERGIRLESVPAAAVEGPLVRYSIDPPRGPVGEKDVVYTYTVRCTFRDARGVESESKMTVTMGGKRMHLWDLFLK